MAKVTPTKTILTNEGSFDVKTRPGAPASANALSLYQSPAGLVARKRSTSKKAPSEAQEAQRQKYRDCDCLWKARDEQQKQAWEDYYTQNDLKTKLHLDSYRVFMAQCLRFNLLEYLDEHLYAEWSTPFVIPMGGPFMILTGVISQLGESEPPPWWEPDTLFHRII